MSGKENYRIQETYSIYVKILLKSLWMKNDRRRRYKLLIYSKIRRKCRRKKNEEKKTHLHTTNIRVFLFYISNWCFFLIHINLYLNMERKTHYSSTNNIQTIEEINIFHHYSLYSILSKWMHCVLNEVLQYNFICIGSRSFFVFH